MDIAASFCAAVVSVGPSIRIIDHIFYTFFSLRIHDRFRKNPRISKFRQYLTLRSSFSDLIINILTIVVQILLQHLWCHTGRKFNSLFFIELFFRLLSFYSFLIFSLFIIFFRYINVRWNFPAPVIVACDIFPVSQCTSRRRLSISGNTFPDTEKNLRLRVA